MQRAAEPKMAAKKSCAAPNIQRPLPPTIKKKPAVKTPAVAPGTAPKRARLPSTPDSHLVIAKARGTAPPPNVSWFVGCQPFQPGWSKAAGAPPPSLVDYHGQVTRAASESRAQASGPVQRAVANQIWIEAHADFMRGIPMDQVPNFPVPPPEAYESPAESLPWMSPKQMFMAFLDESEKNQAQQQALVHLMVEVIASLSEAHLRLQEESSTDAHIQLEDSKDRLREQLAELQDNANCRKALVKALRGKVQELLVV